jgi:hypothetical protein
MTTTLTGRAQRLANALLADRARATPEDLDGTVCRFIQLNVTMSEPLEPDNGNSGSDAVVDVVVPDEAGHTAEVETE